MGPDRPGWGLGVGLTTPPLTKLSVRKLKMWPRKGSEEVHYGGEGSRWAVVPMKKKKKKKKKKNVIIYKSSSYSSICIFE